MQLSQQLRRTPKALDSEARRLRSWFGPIASVVLAIAMSSSAAAGWFIVDNGQEARLMQMRVRAAQFLHRATFGPTLTQIEDLAIRMQQIGQRRAFNEWIDDQFERTPTLHQQVAEEMLTADGHDQTDGGVFIQRYKTHAWWDTALRGEDQLRQRMAWALAQIVVTSDEGAGFMGRGRGNISGKAQWLGPANYYDMLVRNAFGNYRDLLHDVTYHPIMGVYLSHMRNRKTNGVRFPDENYAREVMQLFSIGLHELRLDGRFRLGADGRPIPTYDNETIKNFARVFTGLAFAAPPGANPFYGGNDFMVPMQMFQAEHDSEPKTLLGGEVIDLDDGDAEIEAALDNIYAHRNVAPFVSYRLIQRFVKSNPTRGYVLRVARKFENNGQGVRGDLKAVVKAILTDPEAFVGVNVRIRSTMDGLSKLVNVRTRGTEYSRLREPVIRYTSLIRACRAESDYADGKMMAISLQYHWTQEPYKQPSVFSFFLPGYQPPGELIDFETRRPIPNGEIVSPEFQQKTAVSTNRLMERYRNDIFNRRARFTAGNGTNYRHECNLNFDLSEEDDMNQSREGLEAMIDRFDLLHCCGTLPQDYKRLIADQIQQETNWMRNSPEYVALYPVFRTDLALLSVTLSPFAAVSE